jgi:predicted Fe-Mo cluster-binding NifX family protein
MILAIATTDGVSVCDHLARSTSFVVFDLQDGRIAARAVRERFHDKCGNHAGFVEILAGCAAVICGGIGQGAADSLAANGIATVVAAGKHTVEDAANLYLENRLATTEERVCLCH